MRRTALLLTAAMLLSVVPLGGVGAAPASLDDVGTDAVAEPEDGTNITRLFVEPGYERVELKPGESEHVEVTLINDDDHAVEIEPQVVTQGHRRHFIRDEWVTVNEAPESVAAGEEAEVNLTVSIPEDAELGDYGAQLAFTNETMSYPGSPPRYVHSLSLYAEVFREPTVFVREGRYVHAQVQSGDAYTHEIVVENTRDEAVPLSPKVETQDGHCYGSGCPVELERDWLTIDAPRQVPAGGTATVSVTVEPPADTARGDYDTELTLGIEDPARPEQDRYWQRVRLSYQVWKQPAEAFETDFTVKESDETVSVRVSAADYHRMQNREDPASFDVSFVGPNGTVVEAERERTTKHGSVDLSGRDSRVEREDGYAVRGGQREFVYTLPEPAEGEWTLRVMPRNVVRFNYEIVKNASA